MKKILLISLLLVAGVLTAAAQRTPVKSHSFAFMGLEAGGSANWYQLADGLERDGFGFGGFYAGMHIEFLAGNRLQHGIVVDEGVEKLQGKIKNPFVFEGAGFNTKLYNIYVKPGYKYAFRNSLFVEVFAQLDIPVGQTIIEPTTNRTQHEADVKEKTKLGFSVGIAGGRNITDNFAIVFRLKKSFTDYFAYDSLMPYMGPGMNKGAIIFQMGFSLGFNL